MEQSEKETEENKGDDQNTDSEESPLEVDKYDLEDPVKTEESKQETEEEHENNTDDKESQAEIGDDDYSEKMEESEKETTEMHGNNTGSEEVYNEKLKDTGTKSGIDEQTSNDIRPEDAGINILEEPNDGDKDEAVNGADIANPAPRNVDDDDPQTNLVYTGSSQRSTTARNEPDDSSRRCLVLGISTFVCVVIIALAVAVGILARNQGSATSDPEIPSDGPDLVTIGAPTTKPTVQPALSMFTPPPTIFPSTRPTDGGFLELSSISDAIPLEVVSNCDECKQTIEMLMEYMWDGKYLVTGFEVSSNGRIELLSSSADDFSPVARVNVISTDLDTSRDDTFNVWYYEDPMSGAVIVSWENAPLFDSNSLDTSRLSGQVRIHPEGRIDICWGFNFLEYTYRLFESSIVDYTDGITTYASGPSFDSVGESNPDNLPFDTCQTLLDNHDVITSRLSGKNFAPLSAIPEAVRLEFASTMDDSQDIVNLDRPIRWVGGTISNQLIVSSNGLVYIGPCASATAADGCGQVAVAAGDMLNPSISGDVWFLDNAKGGSAPIDQNVTYAVSWENISLGSQTTRINAQVFFYYNGTIEMCWGTRSFPGVGLQARVFDPRFGVSESAWGDVYFSFNGQMRIGRWPAGLCQSFFAATSLAPVSPSLAPVLSPTRQPLSPQTPYPTIRPMITSPPIDNPPCESSRGGCIGNFLDLVFAFASPGAIQLAEVFALCGGTIQVPEALELALVNATLCCADPEGGCRLFSQRTDRILTVTGLNVTLRNIDFMGGRMTSDGANVAILSEGYHSIENCTFQVGFTDGIGGGLFVANADSVRIMFCSFMENFADTDGGGLAVIDTNEIFIVGSLFEGNTARLGGGGIFFSMREKAGFLSVYISACTFSSNQAGVGGGFLGASLGSDPRVSVLWSQFENNGGSQYGAAGVLENRGQQESLVLDFYQATGRDNFDGGDDCDGFIILMSDGVDVPDCIPIGVDYSYYKNA